MGEDIGARVDIIQLKKRRSDLSNQGRLIREPVIYRVNPFLKNEKKKHFESTVISLGLFDRRSWDHSGDVTKEKDPLKIDVLISFLADIGKEPDNWAEISKEVVDDARDMERLYDQSFYCRIPEEIIRSALAVDSIFVTCFLMFVFNDACPEILRMRKTFSCLNRENLFFCEQIFLDILKIENQIPLVLLRNVLAIVFRFLNLDSVDQLNHENPLEAGVEESPLEESSVKESSVGNKLQIICSKVLDVCKDNLPATDQFSTYNAKSQEYHHLLHFTAEALLDRAKGRSPKKFNSLHRKFLPTAKELHMGGVTFEGQDGFFPNFKQTKFMWWPWKATLFLPRIGLIDDNTESYWRNFLAYDDVFPLQQAQRQSTFICYFDFMDNLVDTEKDVSLLLAGKNPVILDAGIGDNQAVANLFNSMTTNIYIDNSYEWLSLMQEISDFHNHTIGKTLAEIWNTYFSKPWALISVLDN